jgi:anti-sigma regulatory factor (Ser/Thr protein kinase)
MLRTFEIKNDIEALERLTTNILELCHNHVMAEDSCYDIRLALEEAVSNTIKYGYEDLQVHLIHVRAGIGDEEFFLEIEDDGKAFDPLESPDPNFELPVTEKPIGGLGIYLLRRIMDRVEYRRSGAKNILRMTKLTGVRQISKGVSPEQ